MNTDSCPDELHERRLKLQRAQELQRASVRWTPRQLAHAAWKMAGTCISSSNAAFDAWCSTRVKAAMHNSACCPSLIIAIAAWNGAHGRDSLVAFPPNESAIFEPWFVGLAVEIVRGENP